MAKYGKSLAQVVVEINGKQQVQQVLKAMEESAEKLRAKIDQTKAELEELAKGGTSPEYTKKLGELRQLEAEEKQINRALKENHKLNLDIDEVMSNMSAHSATTLANVRRRIEATLRAMKPVGEKERQAMQDMQKDLVLLSDEIKRRKGSLIEFEDIMNNLNSIDDRSLESVIKRLKELIATTDKADFEKLKKYKDELSQAEDVQYRRTSTRAESIMYDVKRGTWKGTIAETEEAIKSIKEYQRVMKDTSPEKVKEVENTFKSLNESLAKAKSEMLSFDEAMEQSAQITSGTWDGTQEDLEKLKRSLEYIKKNKLQFKADSDQLEKVNEALKDIDKTEKGTMMTTEQFNKLLQNLDKATPEQLQLAAKELQERFNKARQGTVEYVQTAAKLRDVNKRILEVNRSLREQENVILRTAKRLASYILVYAGWNEVWGQIKRLTQANLELSDSLADIQKTTGLTETAVGRLSDQINAIDTRTAQKELHDLAYEAGKLGISAEEDVLAFVKAGNQLLVALGEDLGGAEAVRQLMKVNAILGETEKLGVEKALLATGSAINEISQTSRASAGPIADMVSRMGAIGSAAGLSMADLIALAGTADSLGQSAEVAATAFNKFIATLTSNPVDVAYALGMDPDQIQKQLDAGNTMSVIQEIFTKMSTMGDMADLAPIMGELGSEGARMTQVLVTMAKGIGELNAQVYTSKKSFEEATSVTNEYNIKNESAAAIVQRMGNNLRESFVQSGFVEWLRDVLQWLYYLPQRIEDNKLALIAWKTVMWETVTIAGAKFLIFLKSNIVAAYKAVASAIALAIEEQRNLNKTMAAGTIGRAAKEVGTLRLAFQALWRVLSANPFTAIMAGIGLVIAAFQTFRREIKLVDTAKAELETTIQSEQNALRRLRGEIDNANSANGERASLIKQLNEKYGKYLGFLVTESNYVEQQAYIYDLLNAKLRETVSLKMQEKMTDDIVQEHAKDKLDANKDIQSSLRNIESIGESGAPDAMQKLFTEISRQVEAGEDNVEKVLQKVIGNLEAELNQQIKNINVDGSLSSQEVAAKMFPLTQQKNAIADLREGVKDLLKVEKAIAKDMKDAQEVIDAQKAASENQSMNITRNYLDEQFKNLKADTTLEQLQTLQSQTNNYIKQQAASVADLKEKKESLQGLSYAEQREYEELTKEIYGTTEAVEALNRAESVSVRPNEDDPRLVRLNELIGKKTKSVKLSDEEGKKIADANAEIERMNNLLKPINQKLIDINAINIWGSADAEDFAKNSPSQLVAMWDKLEKDASRLSEQSFKTIGEFQEKNGKLMATQFWKNFDTREDAIKWYNKQKDAIAARLKELGYNTSGHFLTSTGSGGDSEQRAQARRDYQAAMSALEAYYKEYEDFIRQQRAKELMTEEDMNRQLLDNTAKYHTDRQQLIKKFLGEESTFDYVDPKTGEALYKNLYKGVLSGYNYFKEKNLDIQAEQYQQWGDSMADGGRNQIAKSGVEIRKAINKEQEKIKKALLEGDVFGGFNDKFSEMLDELGVLTNQYDTEIDRWLAEQRHKQGIGDALTLSPEDRERRISELVKYADKAYQVDEDGLRKLMANNAHYSEWINSLSSEQMTVLLQKLRGYYDDRLALTKKYQDQMKKTFDAYYQQSGKQAEYEQNKNNIELRNQQQSDLEGFGITKGVDYGAKRQSISDSFDVENQKYLDQIANYKEQSEALTKDMVDVMREKGLGSPEYQEMYRQKEAMGQLVFDTELERNQLLAQSQRDLTQVYMDEWTKRAERWGQWGEMFGEYLGEQVMLEKQANDARARGDLETAKKIEQQQKQNKQALIQNLLSKIVDEAALWAKEYALKMMFNSLMLTEEKKRAVEEATLQGKSSMLSILLNALTGQSKEHAKGLPGLVTGAIVFAATMALQAFAKSAISNMFPEADTGSTGTRKLSTGMLTYAEGNYPVLGNDGKVYDAKYEGAGMKTGVYGGGAHFGIFSEKQPEMIVDGKTTQKLILNYPYIYDAITTIAKNGRLVNAMPTFATGDYPAGMKPMTPIATVEAPTGNNEQMERMSAALEQTQAVNNQLLKLLQGGIVAHLDGLETHKTQKRNERFLKRRGIE